MVESSKITIIVLSSLLFVSLFFNIFIPIWLTTKHNDHYYHYDFNYWNKNSNILQKLKDYVKEITTKKNKNYVPKKDRIAVFDMDGTLIGEKAPTYVVWTMYRDTINENETLKNDPVSREIVRQVEEYIKGGTSDESLEIDEIKDEARIFQYWTVENYMSYIRNYLNRDAYGFKNLKFKDMYFKPMIEVINFLQKNSFKVFIVSGSERFFVREIISHFLDDFPMEQVIGTDFYLVGKEEDITEFDYDNLYHYDYLNSHTDYLIKSNMVTEYAVKFTKVRLVSKQIGRKPILSFGNSSGDAPMHNYVIDGNKYKSMAFMVVADDVKREYGIDTINPDGTVDTTNSDNKKKDWKDRSKNYGYEIISMRDDFKTIYGDNVKLDRK